MNQMPHFISRTVEPGPGATIYEAASFTCELARQDWTTRYGLLFHGVWLRVKPDTEVADLVSRYQEQRRKDRVVW